MDGSGGPNFGPAAAWTGGGPTQLGANGSFTSAAHMFQQGQQQQLQTLMEPILWQQAEHFQQLLSNMNQQQLRLQSDFTQSLHDSLRARDARDVRQRMDTAPQDDNPDRVFHTLDPRVQNIMRQLSKEWDRRIERLFHQRNLKSKYDGIEAAGSVHHDFAVEGDREWQFAKEYKAVATPSSLETSNAQHDDAPMRAYDLEQAWRTMRQKHAKECWVFVKQHQAQFLQHLEHTTSQSYFKQEAAAKITEYTDQLRGHYSSDATKRLIERALIWTELKTRSSMGFWSEKAASSKAKEQKRKQELDKAQASYESMDARALFAALTLEAQGVKKQQDGSDRQKRGKPITVHKNSALGSILNQFEPIAKMYNIQVKDNRGSRGRVRAADRAHTSRSTSRVASHHPRRSSKPPSRKSGRSNSQRSTGSMKSRRSAAKSSGSGSKPKNGRGQSQGRSRDAQIRSNSRGRAKTPAVRPNAQGHGKGGKGKHRRKK